jgi:hypothetical protein
LDELIGLLIPEPKVPILKKREIETVGRKGKVRTTGSVSSRALEGFSVATDVVEMTFKSEEQPFAIGSPNYLRNAAPGAVLEVAFQSFHGAGILGRRRGIPL